MLIGFDLLKFVDNSFPAPPTTITTDSVTTPNPEHVAWLRQDKLICVALVGTLSHTLIPLVSQNASSKAAWDTLASTYAKPSPGHINQIKDHLKHITKATTRSISEYMQSIKTCAS